MAAALTPKVSVIIPAYNVTAYIADALDSLRGQSFRDFETIVVNDGCPDTGNLEKVLEPYAGEIVYLKKENGGVSSARNLALQHSRGEYIALLDPDDIWEPEYLESQTRILDSRPDLDLIYPDAVFFGDTSWAGRSIMEVFPSSGEITFQKLAALECRVFVGVTVRREAVFRANLFDT
ncbi:MAG: glycosyltransferase family 2 protein, partial [Acidobacteriaceae bacterium]|nr:glycosyltransferase family 2 protein [Acidobacteriaceae bacterium]